MRFFLLCITLTLLSSVSAEIYRTLDEDGNVIYTDKPSKDAEIIEIDEVQTISPIEVKDFKYTPPVKETEDGGDYASLEIVSPQNDQVITGGSGDFNVSIQVQPDLDTASGDRFILYMDGKKQADSTSTSFSFSNVDRGTHTVKVDVVNKDGNPVISSAPVSFTINRPSILNPNRPPPP